MKNDQAVSPVAVEDIDTGKWFNRWPVIVVSGEQIEVDVPRSARTDEAVRMLRERGARDDAKTLRAAVERADTASDLVHLRTTGRPGWHEGPTYLSVGWRSGVDNKLTLRSEQMPQIAGTLAGWKAGLEYPCSKSTYLTFALGIGFASSIIGFLGDDEGALFNAHAATSVGKTLIGRATVSISRSASRTNLPTYDGSDRGLEELCFESCDHPFVLDELNRLQGDAKALQRVSYMVPSGVGRMRSKAATTVPNLSWRVFGLTTSEKPLSADRIRNGGEEVRHIDIRLPGKDDGGIFNLDPPNAARLAKEVERTVDANYGVAHRPFVEYLVAGGEVLRKRLHERIDGLLDEKATTGFERRFMRKFLIVMIAMEVAVEAGTAPWPRGRPRTVFNTLYKLAREEVLDREEAFQSMLLKLKSGIDDGSFPRLKKGESLGPNFSGFIRRRTDFDILALEPDHFDALCGSKAVAVLMREDADAKGMLVRGADGKSTVQLAVDGSGRGKGRWICFNVPLLSKAA